MSELTLQELQHKLILLKLQTRTPVVAKQMKEIKKMIAEKMRGGHHG
jgi:hypothetical protein